MDGKQAATIAGTETPDVIRHYFIAIAIFWTLIIAGLLAWEDLQGDERNEIILLSQARPFFNQIVTTRLWNARHGGVYVPVTADNPPNPYLKIPNRDVTTTDGVKLTLVNPAYMTRQIAELSKLRRNIVFHLTNEHPIRPANAPEDWEMKAMQGFSERSDEYYDFKRDENGQTYFRYMAPVVMEKACVACHGAYGYSEGEIGGGLSATFPADTVIGKQHDAMLTTAFSHGLIWLIGMAGLGFAWRVIGRHAKEQELLIERLENTLQGMVPICSSCHSIRNEAGEWERLERYITDHSEAEFSHGLCPVCAEKLYGEFLRSNKKK